MKCNWLRREPSYLDLRPNSRRAGLRAKAELIREIRQLIWRWEIQAVPSPGRPPAARSAPRPHPHSSAPSRAGSGGILCSSTRRRPDSSRIRRERVRNSGKSGRRDVAAAKGRQRPVSERPALKKLSQGGTRKVSEGVKKKKRHRRHSPGGGLLQSAGVSQAADARNSVAASECSAVPCSKGIRLRPSITLIQGRRRRETSEAGRVGRGLHPGVKVGGRDSPGGQRGGRGRPASPSTGHTASRGPRCTRVF